METLHDNVRSALRGTYMLKERRLKKAKFVGIKDTAATDGLTKSDGKVKQKTKLERRYFVVKSVAGMTRDANINHNIDEAELDDEGQLVKVHAKEKNRKSRKSDLALHYFDCKEACGTEAAHWYLLHEISHILDIGGSIDENGEEKGEGEEDQVKHQGCYIVLKHRMRTLRIHPFTKEDQYLWVTGLRHLCPHATFSASPVEQKIVGTSLKHNRRNPLLFMQMTGRPSTAPVTSRSETKSDTPEMRETNSTVVRAAIHSENKFCRSSFERQPEQVDKRDVALTLRDELLKRKSSSTPEAIKNAMGLITKVPGSNHDLDFNFCRRYFAVEFVGPDERSGLERIAQNKEHVTGLVPPYSEDAQNESRSVRDSISRRRNSLLGLSDTLALFCYKNKASVSGGPKAWFYLHEITEIDEHTFEQMIVVRHPTRTWMLHCNGEDALHKKWVYGLCQLCKNATLLKDGRERSIQPFKASSTRGRRTESPDSGQTSDKARESKAADELSFLQNLNGLTTTMEKENQRNNKQKRETAKFDIGSTKSKHQNLNLTCPSSTTENRVASSSEDSSVRQELAHLDIISSDGPADISGLTATPGTTSKEGYHPEHNPIRSIDEINRKFHDHAPASNRANIVQVQNLPSSDDDDGIDDDIAFDTVAEGLRDRDHRKLFMPINQLKRPGLKFASTASRDELITQTKFIGYDELANKSLLNANEQCSDFCHRIQTVNGNSLVSIDLKTPSTPVNNGTTNNRPATAGATKIDLDEIMKNEKEAALSTPAGVDSLVEESAKSEDGEYSSDCTAYSDWSDWDEQRLNGRARPNHPCGYNGSRPMSVPVNQMSSNCFRQTNSMQKFGLSSKDHRYEPDENFVDEDWDA